MKEIVVATTNEGKVLEIASLLQSLSVNFISLKSFEIVSPEEDGQTFRENAILKAKYYAKIIGKPCLADDSGLEVDALEGAPGVYSARFAGEQASDKDNNELLLRKLESVSDSERGARFRCAVALVYQDKVLTAEGTCEGMILRASRGQGGFGYDSLFYSPRFGKTLAEVTLDEKNTISHRGQALRTLAQMMRGKFV